jgi:tripartite ATP-independent transporter DctM subunit
MVLYGCVTGVSIGSLFAGGMSAGIFLALLYIIYILARGFLNPATCPSLPPEERASWPEKLAALRGIVLPVLLIIIVLGSILSGFATPTEAAAFGAGGAMLIGLIKRRLTTGIVYSSCYETLLVSSMVGWTMIGASGFSAVFSGLGGNTLITNAAMSMPGGPNMVFVVSAAFIFVLGMFLEPGAIIFLAVPILAPILAKLGFSPLWVGLSFNVLLQCAYLSPPFGFSLFYLRGCTQDKATLGDIYRSSVPFLALQVVCVIIIFLFPQIVLWLPERILPGG